MAYHPHGISRLNTESPVLCKWWHKTEQVAGFAGTEQERQTCVVCLGELRGSPGHLDMGIGSGPESATWLLRSVVSFGKSGGAVGPLYGRTFSVQLGKRGKSNKGSCAESWDLCFVSLISFLLFFPCR